MTNLAKVLPILPAIVADHAYPPRDYYPPRTYTGKRRKRRDQKRKAQRRARRRNRR